MTKDEILMKAAIEQAKKAYKIKEAPIGAVVTKDGEIVGTGYNRRETGKNALYHAEIAAIDDACKRLGGWRLWQCELYVTLEPCPMCAGAVINAQMKRLVYGAFDEKNGACASVTALFDEKFTHIPRVRSRVLEERCGKMLSDFFKQLRDRH